MCLVPSFAVPDLVDGPDTGADLQARRKSAREKRKQRLHVLFDYWSKRGIPPFIEALLKNAPPPEDELPDEVPAFI